MERDHDRKGPEKIPLRTKSMTSEPLLGVPLATFDQQLSKVPEIHDGTPVSSFDPWSIVRPCVSEYARHLGKGRSPDFMDVHDRLPIEAFHGLSFDQEAMIQHQGTIYVDDDLRRLRKEDPRRAMIAKIKDSAWVWTEGSCARIGWNDLVDVHEGIRRFDIGVDGFETTLDWTNSRPRNGYARCCEKWLDGTFAFLVHHKGRHVLTIGFSITSRRQILIQQIQNARRQGNRWMFSFPTNRIEHVLDRFARAFPSMDVMLVDGRDVANDTLKGYRQQRRESEKALSIHAERMHQGAVDADHHLEMMERNLRRALEARALVRHLNAEVPRLEAFYADSGRYARTGTISLNGMRHYRMAA